MATAEVVGTQAPVEPPPPAPPAPAPPPAALAKPAKERIQVHFNPDDPASFYMDTGIFEQMQRVALLMARSNLVPVHLRGEDKVSDCFLVTAQSFRWRMDPFSVAQHTFVLKGKLGYEGKLIAAIINASGKLKGSLVYKYSGEAGPGRKVQVLGRLKNEDEDRSVEGTVDQWSTDNDMWTDDPDQILAYRGARQWARRHMPEAVLGITAEEELKAATRTVEMTRSTGGTFEATRTDKAPVHDVLLDAIGITGGIVLVDPAPAAEAAAPKTATPMPKPKVDPAVCEHPAIPPSRLKPGKTMVCPDCYTDLHGDPIQK